MVMQILHIRTFHEILADWERSKIVLEAAKKSEMNLRKEAFAAGFEDPKEGTNRIELSNGYELKGVRKINYRLNGDFKTCLAVHAKICALGNEGPYIADRLFKMSIDIYPGEYKKLLSESLVERSAKALIDEILITSDGAPTLEIIAPKK